MRSLATLTVTTVATLVLGSFAGHAQTAPSANCGVETWSTDRMAYVSTPCADGETAAEKAKAGEPAVSGTAAYCAALVRRYDTYLARDSRLGGPPVSLDARAAAEKCRAGDPSGIAPLEKALLDARIGLPKHS
jgi:hypothetical protein